MLTFPLFLRVVAAGLILPAIAFAATPDKKTKTAPVAPPPPAGPVSLEVTTFIVRTEGETRKLVVTLSLTLARIDEPDDRYSLIYDPKKEYYIGLEHSNYTWWEFSWPDVRSVIETSKRYENRLQELTQQGISSSEPPPSAGTNNGAATIPDDSGYVWRQTTEKKKIAGLDCTRWTGDTISGESVEVWCYSGSLPKVQAAMNLLRVINEPVSLVPVRNLVPSLVFPVYNALVRGGVTPVLISWGTDQEKSFFGVAGSTHREGKPDLFTVPKLYMKTTLVTMDGLIDQKK